MRVPLKFNEREGEVPCYIHTWYAFSSLYLPQPHRPTWFLCPQETQMPVRAGALSFTFIIVFPARTQFPNCHLGNTSVFHRVSFRGSSLAQYTTHTHEPCSRLKNSSQNKCPCPNCWKVVTLFGRGIFADVINSLEMRSFWITWVGFKSSDRYHAKSRKAEGDLRRKKWWPETGVIQPHDKVYLSPPEARRGRAQNLP